MKFAVAACALVLLAASCAAQDAFPPLDLEELHAQAADYRHRAALLRRSVGLRDQKISEAQARADEIVSGAQADALAKQQAALQGQAQAQTNQDALNFAAAFLPGGDSMLKSAVKTGLRGAGNAGVAMADANAAGASLEADDAVTQAQRDAAPLREQAKALEGDKKKFALKADQYEKLADSKDLLIAAETIRLEAEKAGSAGPDAEKALAAARRWLLNLDL
jgi:hypothetical protein